MTEEEQVIERLHTIKDENKIIESLVSYANLQGNIVTQYEKSKWQDLWVESALKTLEK